jgi:hypothetical protein
MRHPDQYGYAHADMHSRVRSDGNAVHRSVEARKMTFQLARNDAMPCIALFPAWHLMIIE